MTDADLDRLARGAAEAALARMVPGDIPLAIASPEITREAWHRDIEAACRRALGEAVALAAAMIKDLREESGAYRRGVADGVRQAAGLARQDAEQREAQGHAHEVTAHARRLFERAEATRGFAELLEQIAG